MSTTKRLRKADSTPRPSKKLRPTIRRRAIDPSRSTVRASILRVSSTGRIRGKRLKVDNEASLSVAPNTPDDMSDQFLSSGLSAEPMNQESMATFDLGADVSSEVPSTGGIQKNKRDKTSSAMLKEWLQFRDTCLLEIIRGYGLGDYSQFEKCATCRSKDGKYRCLDCFPHCPLRCAKCLVEIHKENPLHRVEEWNGTFFEKTQLKNLSLRVQLGHGGRPCPFPVARSSDFVVIHVNGIHRVNVNFCNCNCDEGTSIPSYVQVLRMGWFPATFERPKTAFTFDFLDLFHKVTLQGKTTLYDFYHVILQLNDSLQLEKTTNRYPEFRRVFRIWRHLQALKYAGRAHDPAGCVATSQGELALECPACPQPGKNLPEDWEDAKPEDRFLYTLFIALDANFKLKQKERAINDIELAPGWSCYVESSRYAKHVAAHRSETEINSCGSDHNAIARANMSVPGYAVNGVGIAICSRHSVIRANGAVDLEKGEKYCSMDYMLLSALSGVTVPCVVVSYDIGCQWSKNLRARLLKYDDDLQLFDGVKLEIGIPSWHVNGHGSYCRNNYSLNYLPGVGRTCGEDIEITWSQTNSLAPSTREMGSGAREETLNDHWNGWNLRKIVGFRPLFLKRFKDACVMRKKHTEAFETFSNTFKATTIAVWTKMVEDWLNDRTKPNPYEEPVNTITLQDVRLELAQEDATAVKNGTYAPHKTSLTDFLMKGLELEEQQITLKYDMSQMKDNLSSKQNADLQEKRNALYCRIQQWREVQLAYMPLAATLLQGLSPATTAESEDEPYFIPAPEEIPLFLPSSVPISLRDSLNDIASKELRLRKAQAAESLESIRRGRRIITGLTQFKKLNICGAGNKPNTRMRALYDRLQRRIKCSVHSYQAAWEALYRLEPDGGTWRAQYHQLDPTKDIRGPGKQPDDPVHMQKGRFEQSWIWMVGHSDGKDITEEQFDDIMRAEWAKMWARQERWEEELKLVVEEMRRTVAFLKWKAANWHVQAYRRMNTDSVTYQGLIAYGKYQAQLLQSMATSCIETWSPALSMAGITLDWDSAKISPINQEVDSTGETQDMDDNEPGCLSDEESYNNFSTCYLDD